MSKHVQTVALFLAAAFIAVGCSSSGLSDLFGDLIPDDVQADTQAGDAEVVLDDVAGESIGGECETNVDCEGVLAVVNPCEIALCDSVQHVCMLGARKDYTPCDDGSVCTADTFCLEGACSNGVDETCDDGNPCTDDSCDAVSGCIFENSVSECDDGNDCTMDDICQDGMCSGEPGACPCAIDEECVFDIADLCSYDEMACLEGFCTVTEVYKVTCNADGDTECVVNTCNPDSGECEVVMVEGSCFDGSTCTVGDVCDNGVCVPGDNMCVCESDPECVEFDDDDLCNGILICQDALCTVDAASVVNCSQVGLSQCEVSVCMSGTGNCAVESKADGAWCDDDNICTETDQCLGGLCLGGGNSCDDGNPCTQDSCSADDGDCQHELLSDVDCDDGDECTKGDLCVAGVCTAGEQVCGECGNANCETVESCISCPEDCGECTGDCCIPQETPGCGDQEIMGCTCDLDPYCCETMWDDICIEEAVSECALNCVPESCGNDSCDALEDCLNCPLDCGECPSVSCCEAHDTPGCDDEEIEACVCVEDTYCCETEWDNTCVEHVESFECGECGGLGGCGNNLCEAPETCFNCPQDCGQCAVCGDDVCDPLESCKLCPADCGICPFCGDETCNDNEDCKSCPADCGECCGNDICEGLFGESCDTCPIDCGECPEECGDNECGEDENCYTCAPDCGACDGTCCVANDSFGCVDKVVQDCVCADDLFCCTVEWDGLCAAQADNCGSCNGDCCSANGTAGCDDEEVEACVCEIDAFCCLVAWDNLCVAEVNEFQCGLCESPVVCGDDMCEEGEDCKSCPDDCGECCGNTMCEALHGEDCTTCPEDCGECPAECGDGVCHEGETCVNCLQDCGDCEGSCCIPNGTPGCINANVQACVCAVDSYCCNVQWDNLCAEEADDCGSCNGDCCAAHNNPGCDDEAVEKCVCGVDPYCCNTAWDNLCVAEVEDEDCGSCEAGDVCGDGLCGDTENCSDCPGDCGECCGNDVCEGLFGEDCATCPGDCGECPAECGDNTCQEGETCVNCVADCGLCAGSCCLQKDSVGCLNKDVQDCVCAIDAFCCEVNWDGICATAADECGSCHGDCCEANDSPGCDDEEVEACVCEQDAYCCNNTWDEICANEVTEMECGECVVEPFCGDAICGADENCELCPEDCGECPPGCGDEVCGPDENCSSCKLDCGACEGSCCIANDSPGCSDPDVQACVCALDTYCCDVQWDSICAGEADDCGSCNGDCCESNGTPGCDNEDIEKCVCAVDAFCCNGQWDNLCVQEVNTEECGDCQAEPVCGDLECNGTETCESCPEDCGECPVGCGDNVCDEEENCSSCPDDCGVCNGLCCIANDTPGCVDPDVTACVCAMDAFCCDHSWDGMCAGEADECGSCNGNCCEANGTPGCDNEEVETCVCAQDSFCCEDNWDSACVDEVEDLNCGVCNSADCGDGDCNDTEDCETCPEDCGECPKPGNCCESTDVPGCLEAQIMDCVCAQDSFCCENSWDNLCVEHVEDYGCGECLGSCCGESEEPGCSDSDCMDAVCQVDSYCCDNAWDSICVDEAEEICGDLCTPPPECGDGLCNGDENCTTCPLDCGLCDVECGDGLCQDDSGEDCETCWQDCGACEGEGPCCVSNGSPGCMDDDIESCVCAMDSFCCNNTWDSVCAEMAEECNSCGGDCCADNGSPGCSNSDVEECVCAQDSYCCEVFWDDICVGEVDEYGCGTCDTECGDDVCEGFEDCETCSEDCGYCLGEEFCCAEHDTPGCAVQECQDIICEQDSYCCEFDWDEICADEALDKCGFCQVGAGSCCEDNDLAGCEDLECQLIVCTEDLYCCDDTWDSICADAAVEMCADLCPAEPEPFCGDGECTDDEDCDSCAVDCGLCPSDSDCCTNNGTPGCDAQECQVLVCAEDPFCCNSFWDGICADWADDLCFPLCADEYPQGDCCEVSQYPGCIDPLVQACVCSADPYCCNDDWDVLCVDGVEDSGCGVCE
jgi:hypothetical protein